MYIKVKIDENQEFKKMIIKRIQQELHEILKTKMDEVVKEKIENYLSNQDRWDLVESNFPYYIKEFVENRVKKIVGTEYPSRYNNKTIDKYIDEFIQQKMNTKFEELFEKRFQTKVETK